MGLQFGQEEDSYEGARPGTVGSLYPRGLESSDMSCPNCGDAVVRFPVPPELHEYAPDGSAHAAICTTCLTVVPADEAPPEPDFSRVADAVPDGDVGVAMALAIGLVIESVALNREAIATLFERVQDEGVDPWLVLERLDVAGSLDPDADVERAYRQLDQLLR